jgi:hypothetical protein
MIELYGEPQVDIILEEISVMAIMRLIPRRMTIPSRKRPSPLMVGVYR